MTPAFTRSSVSRCTGRVSWILIAMDLTSARFSKTSLSRRASFAEQAAVRFRFGAKADIATLGVVVLPAEDSSLRNPRDLPIAALVAKSIYRILPVLSAKVPQRFTLGREPLLLLLSSELGGIKGAN